MLLPDVQFLDTMSVHDILQSCFGDKLKSGYGRKKQSIKKQIEHSDTH